MTRTASVDAAGCADHTTSATSATAGTVESADSSPPAAGEADSDPPSRRRLARHGTFAAALVLGGVVLLGFSASPASAQEGGGDGGSTSSSGSDGGGMSSSGMSSSDGGMSSSSDGGMSSSFSSSGCCSSDGSMSSTSTDSSGGYGSTDSSTTSSFSSSSYGPSDSGFTSTDTGVTTSTSYGPTTDSATGSFGSETSYGGSPTGTTGFEGSPETGPAHAQAVSADSSTYSGTTDTGVTSGTTRGISTVADTAAASSFSSDGADTGTVGTVGTTGFEGSSEVGPAHAEAVDANASTWSGEITSATTSETVSEATGLTGFEGSPEVGPVHAEAISAEAQAPADDLSYLTGFENSPELGPRLAQDMLAAEQAGRFDANELAIRLSEAGIDPNTFDPTQLRDLGRMSPTDPRYSQLVDAITTLAGQIESPLRGDDRIASPYATRAFETLDVEGTRALVGAINQLAFNRAWMSPDQADVRTTMLDPVALGFSYATKSPVAPASVFDGLRALESRWQQHQLGQLISAGFSYDPATGETSVVPGVSYDPTQLAQFANAITEFGRTHQMGIRPNASTIADPAFNGRYGLDALNTLVNPASLMFQGPEAWNGDVAMQVPEALALRALSINPEASFQFTGLSPENLATVVRPSDSIIGYWGYTNEDVSQLKGLMDQYGADTIRGALVDAVANELSRYPTALDRYADVTRLMAQDVRTSDPVRQAYADVLGSYFTTPEGQLVGSYINDIGEAAVRQRETRYASEAERMAQDFNRVDLMNAFREVGMSEEAARTVGQVVTAWTALRAAGFLGDDNLQQGEVNTALRPNALVLDTIRQGFEDIGVPTASQKALADSIRYWGSILAAGAGPVANAFGGAGLAVPAAGAGLFGSLTWAGSTYAAANAEQVSPPGFHGDDLARSLTLNLRQDLANAVAQRDGVAPPAPGQVQSTLDRAFPEVGDPMDAFLGLSAIEGYLNARRGTHWSH